MPKFVMLSTLGPDGHARLREQPERLREVNADVEAMGVRVLEQYALLGQYDFLNILEAPDELTMAKVATTLASRGTLKTLTLTAVEVEDFIEVMGGGVGPGPSHTD
ncbi:GYD domain-containing protein [soil metagenome]